uniref:DNA/RNA-binding protein Alba-like domain-containing protein n=3 Tax=Triticinae TaxID=1648030 RepID=A0A453EBF3_AEGTS
NDQEKPKQSRVTRLLGLPTFFLRLRPFLFSTNAARNVVETTQPRKNPIDLLQLCGAAASQPAPMAVEGITEGVRGLKVEDGEGAAGAAADAPAAAAAGGEGQRRGASASSNRIQVSNTKKPLFFYVNLAKRYMQQHGDVELSALGMAIATVVTVAEILKNNGLAVEKKIRTSTVEINDESRGRPFQKAKIEIELGKSEKFDELMASAAADAEEGEEEA